MSKHIHDQKAQAVTTLTTALKAAPMFLIYEYAGLTAKEATVLRASLKRSGCEMTVYQNNILNRSLRQSGIMENANFKGPNALVLGSDDIEPLKGIAKLAKDKPFIKLKAALIENNLMLGAELDNFASLSSRKDLYAMFCQCLQSPIRKLMFAIQAVADKK